MYPNEQLHLRKLGLPGSNQARAVTLPYDKGISLPLVDFTSPAQLPHYQFLRGATSTAHVPFK